MFKRLFGFGSSNTKNTENVKNVLSNRAPRNATRRIRPGSVANRPRVPIASSGNNIENVVGNIPGLGRLPSINTSGFPPVVSPPPPPPSGLVGITSGNSSPPIVPPASGPGEASNWRVTLRPYLAEVLDMTRGEEGVRIDVTRMPFKPKYEAILALEPKMDEAEAQVKKLRGEATLLTVGLRTAGIANKGYPNFRGKNAPAIYAAESGNSYEARGNFTVDGFPIRVTDANSLDAVFAKMKSRKGQVKTAVAAAKSKRAQIESAVKGLEALKADYIKKIREFRKFVQEEYAKATQAARASARAKLRAPRMNTGVEAELAALSTAPRSRFSLFGKRGGSKRGGSTRRRSASRKTRKNRRNNRK